MCPFSKRTAVCLAVLMLTVLPGQLVHGSSISKTSKAKQLRHYYRFIETVVSLPLEQQIDSLKKYIEESPGFERAYHKLLECYVVADKEAEAEKYFQDLVGRGLAFRYNGYWMLAKIADHRDMPEKAFAAYQQATTAEEFSVEFLNDCIEFEVRHSGKFKIESVQSGSTPDLVSRKTVSILSAYHRRKYKEAGKEIGSLPDSISHQPLLVHIRGRCFYKQGDQARADSLWHIGLAISRLLGDQEGESRALTTIGVLAANRFDYEKAISYYDSARVIANRGKDLYRIQLIAGNWADMLKKNGEYLQALEKCREAIRISEQIKDYPHLTTWYSSYAQILYYMENFDEALKVYDKSEELAVKQDQKRRQINIKMDRANIYQFLNLSDLARNEYGKAYELAAAYNIPDLQKDANAKMAELLLTEGEYAKARRICQQYISDNNSETNLLWQAYYTNLLGHTYIPEGKLEQAMPVLLQALEIAREAESPYYIASFIKDIANLKIKMDDWKTAIKEYQTVLDYATSSEDNELLVAAYWGLGSAYKNSGSLKQAVSYYKKSVSVIEEERRSLKASQMRIGYFSQRTPVYQKLVDCYLQYYQQSPVPAYLDSVFYYSELGRGRSLLDIQRGTKLKDIPQNTAQYREYRQLCNQLRIVQRTLRLNALEGLAKAEGKALQAQLEALRYSLIAGRIALGGLEPESNSDASISLLPETISGLSERLTKVNMGLLSYHISGEQPFVLAISGEQARIVFLPVKNAEIDSTIRELMSPFHRINRSNINTTPFKAALAYQLYLRLIKPVEDHMKLPQRLFIVPGIALVNLPFELLLTQTPDQPEYTPTDHPAYAENFLQNRYTIVYSPNVRVSQQSSSNSMVGMFGKKKLLAFANPFNFDLVFAEEDSRLRTVTDWYYPSLPYSQIEAESLKTIYPSTKVFQQEQATKRMFMKEAPKHQILHIATHGIIDTTFEAFSGLVLAIEDDSTDDGCLMGYELSEMELDCDLITLSACETGRGKLVSGEGVLGLPRVLLGAGAKSVLMTLWKIDDQFTSELMVEFYRQFFKQNLSKADALAEAKRSVLSRYVAEGKMHYKHPLYWATFTLYGDPGSGREYFPFQTFLIVAVIILSTLTIGLYLWRRKI